LGELSAINLSGLVLKMPQAPPQVKISLPKSEPGRKPVVHFWGFIVNLSFKRVILI
jgi:hypothetical protein